LPVDLILYALVAAGLVLWLKNLLGTRTGEERERPNPFTAPVKTADAKPETPLLAAAMKDSENTMDPVSGPAYALPRHVTVQPRAQEGLGDILDRDSSFDPGAFVLAAQDAFVIIVEAFAAGDKDTLKNLLTDKVFASFESAVNDRAARGEKISTEIHAIRRADVMDAKLQGRDASITLKFTADETCVIRDSADNILGGHPDRVTEMVDIWTFTRDIKSRDPRWLVSETRDGDVEDHKTPVPDAG
jgi:predicted lipid-binding transport protein (Tim44 family)